MEEDNRMVMVGKARVLEARRMQDPINVCETCMESYDRLNIIDAN